MASRYRLDDPRPTQRAAPYTYYLPGAAAIAAVAPGDQVKLIFRSDTDGAEYGAERMWVTVTHRDGDKLTGDLDNKPIEITGISLGDRIDFAAYHIININWQTPESAPEDEDHTAVWLGRCFVDRAVVDGRATVGFLFRDEPDTPEGAKYPDTGWCLRPHEEDIGAEEYAAEDVVYVAIGAVLNQDDSFKHLLGHAPGHAFERGEDGVFVSVPFEQEDGVPDDD